MPPASRSALKKELWKAFESRLNWLASRKCWPRIDALCDTFEGYFSVRQISTWNKSMDRGQMDLPALVSPVSERRRLKLALVGTFQLQREDRELRSLRGARVRTLCGLITAAELVGRKPDNEDFARILAENETNLSKARNIQYVTVHRLRDTFGFDVIQTEGELPTWNEQRIQVDLVSAMRALDECTRQTRRGILYLGVNALKSAQRILLSGELFFGLKHEFFEAVREDFAAQHRRATTDLILRLEQEEDSQQIIELLRPWLEAFPDDDELGKMLCSALERCAHHAEAARLRLHMRTAD